MISTLEFEVSTIRAQVRDDFPGLSLERRTKINNFVFSNPELNYIFSGDGGLGKSYLASAIGDIARLYGYKVLRTSGPEWEADVRSNVAAEFGAKKTIEVSAPELRRADPLVIIFDEISRVRQTEFIINQFQDLLDAVKAGGHQLIATTNRSKDDFKLWAGDSLWWRFHQKSDGKFGGLGCRWVRFENK